jgi:hypothetical protein
LALSIGGMRDRLIRIVWNVGSNKVPPLAEQTEDYRTWKYCRECAE